MVDEIEARLRKSGKGEVAASDIGDMVMEGLRQLDGIAYIRFASVYRDFADIDEVRAAADAYINLRLSQDSTTQLPLFADVAKNTKIPRRKASTLVKGKGAEKPIRAAPI
jgi:hypothetical protein